MRKKKFLFMLMLVLDVVLLSVAFGDTSRVPVFKGITIEEAKAEIAARDDLKLGESVQEYNWDVPESWVMDQTPPPDTLIGEGQTVTVNLTVSRGRRSEVTAGFNAYEDHGFAPLQVRFFDHSFSSRNPIKRWLWDFGDGTTSIDQEPQHTYMMSGTYTVSLTVTTSKQETAAFSIKDAVVVLASESASMGPDGGTITSAKGASYTVGQNIFSGAVRVHISDTPEASIRQSLPPEVPYNGSVTIALERDGVTISDDYRATIIVPLNESLPPGKELDVYGRGMSYGQWFWHDEKAVVNGDGFTATLIVDKVGTFIVRVPDKYSIPTVDCQGSTQDNSGTSSDAASKSAQ